LATERYEVFKLVVLSMEKNLIDMNKYEDLLRCLFGNGAYLLFTLDKTINLVHIDYVRTLVRVGYQIPAKSCYRRDLLEDT
jgi:hypothetical protein